MTRYQWITVLLLSLLLVLPALAAPARNVITTAQVAAAISDMGMTVSAQQITLLSDAATKTSTPSLKVQYMEPWGDLRMKVRMGCATLDQCLPFYVAVSRNPHSSANAVSLVSAVSPVSPVRPLSADAARSLPATPPAAPPVTPHATHVVVKSGSSAVLLLDSNHVHIQLVVVCLENGSVGQTIRVASKDRRQKYIAEVCDGGVLKGRL
jgi:hypothetical protein